mgnify:CR=1 FL=1
MKKTYTIFKTDLNNFLSEISQAMTKAKIFYNVSTKNHKDNNKIIVIIG